ncbi:MAG: hypothetical protein ABIT83_14465 [Massilia sp.]
MARPNVQASARAIVSADSRHSTSHAGGDKPRGTSHLPGPALFFGPARYFGMARMFGHARLLAPSIGLPAALATCLSLSTVPAHAQTAEPMPKVVIARVKDPVDKSYRAMIKGMDRFERERALAPQASLRFRLWPRLPNASLDGVTLRVAGDTLTLPVTIGADYSFVLPRSEQALREDAAVLANRKTASLTWRAWVQTPGLPPGARRLGDLRLECRVGMDARLISNSAPLFGWLSNMLANTEETCTSPQGNYLFFAERPIFGVTLRDGARREALPFKLLYASGEQTPQSLPFCDCQVLLDRSYYAPLWDRSWSDDTVLEFEYMDLPAAALKAAP